MRLAREVHEARWVAREEEARFASTPERVA
jgi:hypothetical protein